jgi:hypothetical protein
MARALVSTEPEDEDGGAGEMSSSGSGGSEMCSSSSEGSDSEGET